jgi:hypothetical protein
MTLLDAPPSKAKEPAPVRRFQPSLTLGHSRDLSSLAIDLAGLDVGSQVVAIGAEIAGAERRRAELKDLGVVESRLMPSVKYLAALRLLRDLVEQGWRLRLDDEGIYLTGPDTVPSGADDPTETKNALRQGEHGQGRYSSATVAPTASASPGGQSGGQQARTRSNSPGRTRTSDAY